MKTLFLLIPPPSDTKGGLKSRAIRAFVNTQHIHAAAQRGLGFLYFYARCTGQIQVWTNNKRTNIKLSGTL